MGYILGERSQHWKVLTGHILQQASTEGRQEGLGLSRKTRRGERFLLLHGELHPVPGGDPSGPFLLERQTKVFELWSNRVGDWTRGHSWVRRCGKAVRRGREPCRLVAPGDREEVPEEGAVHDQPVRSYSMPQVPGIKVNG